MNDAKDKAKRQRIFDDEGVNALAVRFKELRKKAGYTLKQLAFESGIDYSQLARLETFKTNPSVSIIFVAARTMEIDPEEFFKFKLTPREPNKAISKE